MSQFIKVMNTIWYTYYVYTDNLTIIYATDKTQITLVFDRITCSVSKLYH